MDITLEQVSKILNSNDNFYILTHQYPDGDTLGSAFALLRVLRKMGKKATVLNNEKISNKFNFLVENGNTDNNLKKFVIAVDVADEKLLGENLQSFYGKIDLCIDHHSMNKNFSKLRYIDAKSASTTQIIYDLFEVMKVKIDAQTANCIYTGLATDTGCFKYKNTSAKTHVVAAKMMEFGANAAKINKLMFELKTREQFIAERYIFDSIEFYFENKLAIIFVTLETLKKSGADDASIDGIAGVPKQIKGVLIGATFRQKEDHLFKISVRTDENIDAAIFCKHFGGGGHVNAAGCTLEGNLTDVKKRFIEYAGAFLNQVKYNIVGT